MTRLVPGLQGKRSIVLHGRIFDPKRSPIATRLCTRWPAHPTPIDAHGFRRSTFARLAYRPLDRIASNSLSDPILSMGPIRYYSHSVCPSGIISIRVRENYAYRANGIEPRPCAGAGFEFPSNIPLGHRRRYRRPLGKAYRFHLFGSRLSNNARQFPRRSNWILSHHFS